LEQWISCLNQVLRRESQGGRDMERRQRRGFAVAVLLTGLLASEAWGKTTLFVANNGVDGASCGTSNSPCRSLSKAIQNASAGDKISVGPGRYGDLNRDGAFSPAAGEEAAEDSGGCACMIKIDKAVTIESKSGAGATILDAGGGSERIVRIQASGVTFGNTKKGFTLVGGADFGVVLDDGTADVSVGGNLVTDTNLEAFSISGSEHSVAGNIANANGGEGFVVDGPGHSLKGNLASGNEDNGFRLAFTSSDVSLVGNASTGNGDAGFRVTGTDHSLTGNVASGNQEQGFRVFETGHVLKDNAAVGNRRSGIVFENAATGSAKRSNLYGNDVDFENCGLLNQSNSTVDATSSFWGAAGGPGDEPADAACSEPGSTTFWDPPSNKEISVKPKLPF